MIRWIRVLYSPRLIATVIVAGLLIMHMIGVHPFGFIRIVDTHLYDEKMRWSLHGVEDPQVVIVDIDEKSLAAEGRWPWSRNKMARLTNHLFDHYGVASAGFDIVFAEPDNSSGIDTLKELAKSELKEDVGYLSALHRVAKKLDFDQQFAKSLEGRPVALGYYLSKKEGEGESTGTLPAPLFVRDDVPEGLVLRTWRSFGSNLTKLANAAAGGGFMNFVGDFDGNARRVPLLSRYEGDVYEALSLSLLRTTLGAQVEMGFGEAWGGEHSLESLRLKSPYGEVAIPVDEHGAALIPFYGKAKTFPYVSAVDVLRGKTKIESLQGKIALVGTSAPGLLDLRSTPVGTVYPGVEIHANLITGVLNGDIKERPGFMLGAEVALLIFIALVMLTFMHRLGPIAASVVVLALIVLVVGLNVYAWQSGWVVLNGPHLVFIAAMYLFSMAWGYFSEFRHKRHFADLFGQYVPPELVEEMAKAPKRYSMNGRNEVLTVLFSDVRDFTTISESMDPEDLAHLMNVYLDKMTVIIREYRGTLDKYIGDAIMAFWGAPIADEAHARNAVLSALAMVEAQQALEQDFEQRGWPILRIGIGISSGKMTVGDMGSTVRKAYTVMGDNVNLGARLEGLTKGYGLQILISEGTRAMVPDILCRVVDLVRVKGKAIPITIYEPVGVLGKIDPVLELEVLQWNQCVGFYQQQRWVEAEQILRQLIESNPLKQLYQQYQERINEFIENPPPANWDGVVTYKTK